jgi:hypothetical protein
MSCFSFTLFVFGINSVVIFFSSKVEGFDIKGSCCFIFISLLRRFTFCPSLLSSVFGARFRRILSVVDNFFNVLFDTDVADPNNRNGDVGIGLKSRISISGGFGFAISC